jgi:hypothetical protein
MMLRKLACLSVLLLMTAGGGRVCGAQAPPPDTVYVARYEPVEVVPRTPSDTLMVRGADEEDEPVTTRRTADHERGTSGITLGGIVVDETFSVIGRDFYDTFYRRWEDPDDAANFTISIRERPQPRRSTQVSVTVEERVVFRSQLRPRPRTIQRAAQQAVARATLYLKKYYEPREVY